MNKENRRYNIQKKRGRFAVFFIFLLTSLGGAFLLLVLLPMARKKITRNVFVFPTEKKGDFEEFSLAKDAFLPTISVMSNKENEAIVELREVYELLNYFFRMDLCLIERINSFFNKGFQGFSSLASDSLIAEVVIPRKVKKMFLPFSLYYHSIGCNGKRCCSDFFIKKDCNVATTLEAFSNCCINPKKDILDLLPGEVLISLISSVSCSYSGTISHCTSLIVVREKVSLQLRAYYCDSFGQDMPKILRSFLKEVGLAEKNIDYLKFSQQIKSGYCGMFAIYNAKIASELMFNEASFEEINRNKKLNFQPSVLCLREVRLSFLKCYNKKLGEKMIERIKIFISSIDKLFERINEFVLSETEIKIIEHLKDLRGKLFVIANLIEEKFILGEDLTYLFINLLLNRSVSKFREEETTSLYISFCSKFIWYLNHLFFLKAGRLFRITRRRFVECVGCKSVLKNKEEFCFLKSSAYRLSYFEELSEQDGCFVDVPVPDLLKLERSKKTCSVCGKYWSLLKEAKELIEKSLN